MNKSKEPKSMASLEGRNSRRAERPAAEEQSVIVIATLGFLVINLFLFFASRKKKTEKQKRRLSFTSVGLGIGSFPPKKNVKEPIINTAVYFEDDKSCPSSNDVATLIIKPLLEYERLSSVPDLDNRTCRPSNLSVEPLELIRELSVDGDEKFLNETIVEHCQDTLGSGRHDLPWWEILILRNSGSGPSACVIRVHHVIGDGLALVAAFEKLLTTEDGKPIHSPVDFKCGASSSNGGGKKNKGKKGILSTAYSLIEATGHCLTLGASKYDDDTVFSKMNHSEMKHSGKREAVMFPTVPLDFVKQLKSAAGVTVNDILMTAVSQAIHDYCESQDDKVLAEKGSAIQCRGLLPVGFPRSQDELNDQYTAFRNMWCMVSCDMGVGHSDIEDRLKHIHTKTTEMKEKPRAFMQLNIQNTLGPYIPESVGQQTVFDTFSRHSLVLTNVPGPSDKVLFAGKKVVAVQLFFDNLLTQVDFVSYAGQIYGNIIFDADQLPNSEIFGRLYMKALVKLAKKLNVKCPLKW